VPIRPYFKQVISSESIGYAKEDQRFWQTLQQRYPFDVSQVTFIDDNYAVLDSAKQFGIAQLFSISEPDSSNTRTELNPNYLHLDQLTDLLNYLDDDKSSNLYGT
jgi:putative hydrolase of the HAD superfamily